MKNCPNNNSIYKNDGVEFLSTKRLFEDFVSEKLAKGKSERTMETYRNHLNFFIKSQGCEDCDIREITTKTWNDFVKVLKKREVSSATIKSYSNSLRSFFNWCYDQGEIFYKISIPMVKAKTKIKQTYSDDELMKLLKKPNVRTCSFTEYKVWVLENLACCTGLRISSLINIRIGEVSFDDCSIIVNVTKNGDAFMTYFNNDMKKILQEYLTYRKPESSADYLFCKNNGKKIARRTIQEEIADYNKARGVTKTSVHLFRHTFAKNAMKAGLDVVTLMSMLQHSSLKTTYNYLRELGLEIKEKVNVYNPQQKFVVNDNSKRIKMR